MRMIDADALLTDRRMRMYYHLPNGDIAVPVIDIEHAPTIEERKWILSSERLPEDLEEVNVTWVNHDPEPYYNFVKDKPFTATAVYYKGKWYWYSSVCADILAEYGKNDTDEIDSAIEITAWMPLPESYSGETKLRNYENKGDDD